MFHTIPHSYPFTGIYEQKVCINNEYVTIFGRIVETTTTGVHKGTVQLRDVYLATERMLLPVLSPIPLRAPIAEQDLLFRFHFGNAENPSGVNTSLLDTIYSEIRTYSNVHVNKFGEEDRECSKWLQGMYDLLSPESKRTKAWDRTVLGTLLEFVTHTDDPFSAVWIDGSYYIIDVDDDDGSIYIHQMRLTRDGIARLRSSPYELARILVTRTIQNTDRCDKSYVQIHSIAAIDDRLGDYRWTDRKHQVIIVRP